MESTMVRFQTFWIKMMKNKPLNKSCKTGETSGTKMAFYYLNKMTWEILTLTDHGNEKLSIHLKLSASKTLMSASLFASQTIKSLNLKKKKSKMPFSSPRFNQFCDFRPKVCYSASGSKRFKILPFTSGSLNSSIFLC
ncbi:hypothetical protein Hanom_Chr10g00874711 [Helianthus anomalus]